jgi:hypothetical protein
LIACVAGILCVQLQKLNIAWIEVIGSADSSLTIYFAQTFTKFLPSASNPIAMAGRPRTMAKRLATLLAKATELGNEFLAVMPATYRERPIADPLCEAWKDRLTDLADTYHSIDRLLGLLQAKVPAPPVTFTDFQHAEPPAQSAAELLREYQESA